MCAAQPHDLIETPRGLERIPEGKFYLVGDNPEFSVDSRNYGPVPMALCRGRVVARVRAIGLVVLLTVEWADTRAVGEEQVYPDPKWLQ